MGDGRLEPRQAARRTGPSQAPARGRDPRAVSTLSAVVLTEINPSYSPAGDSLDRYIEVVPGTLLAGLGGPDR